MNLLHPAARGKVAEVDRGVAESSKSVITRDFASASSPDRKITRLPPASFGSEPSTAAASVFAALTTRAPGTLPRCRHPEGEPGSRSITVGTAMKRKRIVGVGSSLQMKRKRIVGDGSS